MLLLPITTANNYPVYSPPKCPYETRITVLSIEYRSAIESDALLSII